MSGLGGGGGGVQQDLSGLSGVGSLDGFFGKTAQTAHFLR